LNRAFPGNDRGWIVERIAQVISEYIIPTSDIVIDFHGEATNRFGASYYAYLFKTHGKLGKKTDEFTYDLGLEIVVNCAEPQPNTLVGYARSKGKVGLAVELCDFYGLEGDPQTDLPKRSSTEAGVTCVLNTLKKLGMIEGELKLPRKQVVLEGGYVGVAPSHGGLLCPKVTRKDIGRVFRKEQLLGTIISPYTFKTLDKLQMPFEETMVLAVKDNLPFTHIEPGAGDIGFEVCDWNEKRWIIRSEGKGG
jgi:predicted deacylase